MSQLREDAGTRSHRAVPIGITHFRNVVKSGGYKLEEADVNLNDPNIMGQVFTLINPRTPDGFQKTKVRVSTDRATHDGDYMFHASLTKGNQKEPMHN